MKALHSFHTPAQFFFGEGCSSDIAEVLQTAGKKSILFVTDKNLMNAGISHPVIECLEKSGITVRVYDDIVQNPTEENVERGRDILLREKQDAVVALGGGSPIDAAKAISVLSVHDGSIIDYEYGLKPIERRGPEVFLIPTTAGTGSEVTYWSVITDTKTNRKLDVGSPLMSATASFVDPELTYDLPKALTAATGMDALCHALEAVASVNSWPTMDALAYKAISLIGSNLLLAYREPHNVKARRAVMMGSTTAGMAFPNAGLGAVHGLTAPLGGHFGVPHGVANAMMLPHVMEFNKNAVAEKYKQAARILDLQDSSAEGMIRFVVTLTEEMDIPKLKTYGITEDDLSILAKDALGRNSNCNTNPEPVSIERAVELYRKVL